LAALALAVSAYWALSSFFWATFCLKCLSYGGDGKGNDEIITVPESGAGSVLLNKRTLCF
jgi:hypothetical protein